jgi:hypothetical protein
MLGRNSVFSQLLASSSLLYSEAIRRILPVSRESKRGNTGGHCPVERLRITTYERARVVMKRLLKWVVSGLYGLVMIEVIIMISPFAFYWYSLYAPALQGLHRWRATAWMEAFFLPHSVITTSPFLEFNRWVLGTYALSLGIVGFIFCAVQV